VGGVPACEVPDDGGGHFFFAFGEVMVEAGFAEAGGLGDAAEGGSFVAVVAEELQEFDREVGFGHGGVLGTRALVGCVSAEQNAPTWV
jgi:hypothetical protein